MNRRKSAQSLVLAGLALLALGSGLALTGRAASASSGGTVPSQTSAPLHPAFALLDADGANVLNSRRPISTMQTCGQCHDTEFIAEHSFHVDPGNFGNWNAITYRFLSPSGDELVDLTTPDWLMRFGERHVGGGPAESARDGRPLTALAPGTSPEAVAVDPQTGELVPWDWSASGVVEMNCFLCHLSEPDLEARAASLATGQFGWANTATLASTGIVAEGTDGYVYDAEAFSVDGTVSQDVLGLQDPTNRNCGACHGVVHTDPETPLDDAGIAAWRTSTTGQIISPQRISDSALNISGIAGIGRTWDVHAERVVACTDCHFSLNNPVFADPSPGEDLAHLLFDPRRLDLGAYIRQPDHNFARGSSGLETIDPALAGTMRRCESCHDAGAGHGWLPYTDRHMSALSCETCHVPKLYAPAIASVDWTVLTPAGEPVTTYRGIADAEAEIPLITGFEPVLLPAADVDGNTKLAPFNLVSAWYWVYGEAEAARPVRAIDLEAAWLDDGGSYAGEVLAVFDANADGGLDPSELVIDSDAKVALIAGRLADLGLENPRITGEVRPYPIHHGAASGDWATGECSACHAAESRITRPAVLSAAVPGGVLPELLDSGPASPGRIEIGDGGALRFTPDPAGGGLYLLGHDRVGWIDGLGIALFFGTLLGVSVHGGMRYLGARRKAAAAHQPEIRAVYMYSVYERFWHWLQTASILILLATGLVIHKPDTFGIFGFRHVVLVHNVLGGILVVNAALSLFYHLVSGEIRQYLPRPRGFFDDAIRQAKYYLLGIFRGSAHPFEKTPERKLNPLQQATYFGILNVLLPLQVITGILMWGAQRWPGLADRVGGLAFLGPFHSLIAWTFAAFIVGHVYLTTTGPSPSAGIRAMMLGWDEVEVQPDPAPSAAEG